MKVTMMRDGISAKDDKGTVYKVNGLVIKKDRGYDAFYPTKDRFFKVACPYNTVHEAVELESGEINLI